MRYQDLGNDVDRLLIARMVKDIIRKLNESRTLKMISARANELCPDYLVSENSLKMFLNREQSRINPKSSTVGGMFDLIQIDFDNFPAEVRDVANVTLFRVLGEREPFDWSAQQAILMELSGAVSSWMRVAPESLQDFRRRISGDFFVFRKSARHAHTVLKSKIEFIYIESLDLIQVSHHVTTIKGKAVLSTGVAMPMDRGIYCLLVPEIKHRYLEVLAIADDPDGEIQKLSGVIITSDGSKLPICAKIVLVRCTAEWNEVDNRILLHENNGNANRITKEVLQMLDLGTAAMADG